MNQAKGTPLTAVRRAMLSLGRQTLLGKDILCVGDDDLVSVAVGFLLKKLYKEPDKIRTRICVFEKDKRYVEYIREIGGRYGLPIECVEVDLQEPFPFEYAGRFDVFYTDPPYTLEGLSLFLSRGIGGLKKEKGLKIFLSFGRKPNGEIYRMQQALLSHGLIITAIYDAFNRYEGASLLGGISQLLVLETTDYTQAAIPATMYSRDQIYTADKRETSTVYKCRYCGARIAKGKIEWLSSVEENHSTEESHSMEERHSMGERHSMEAYDTIEKLKEAGCPKCGGKVFDQVRTKPI
jgi:predicted methyltransferase